MRALIFDLDGTLIDSKLDLIHAVNATLKEMGRATLSDQVISSYIGHGASILVARALGGVTTEDELSRALKFFLAYYEEHKLDNTCLYSRRRLTRWRSWTSSKMTMAVLTNKPVKMSVRILEALGVAKHFRVIYGGNSFRDEKTRSARSQHDP